MDVGSILQAALAYAATQKGQQLTQEEIDVVRQQMARVLGVPLPQLPQITPDQLGQSAMGNMAPDEGDRSKQLQAIAELQGIIDKGGMDFTDEAAMQNAVETAQNQQKRAQAGVAQDAAARGQLNSGNRLMMDMNAASTGANAARDTELQAAAAGQQRRLAAINDAAGLVGSMRSQDWGEKAQAAQAKDMRDELNRNAREKANYYNAGLPQQGFENAMAKATGTGNPTNSLQAALENAGNQTRADAAMGVNAIGAATKPSGGGGGGGGGDTYTYTTPGAATDESGGRGGPSDFSGGQSLPEEDNGAGFT